MSLRTPLARVRGLGSTRTGTEHFWLQRLTAVANLPLVIFLVFYFVCHLNDDRASVVASFHNPFIAVLFALALISVIWHMKLGMQIIIEDYVHGHGAKLSLLVLNIFFPIAMLAVGLFAIFKMSIGS